MTYARVRLPADIEAEIRTQCELAYRLEALVVVWLGLAMQRKARRPSRPTSPFRIRRML
jgi:hypothetical protein